MDEQTKHVLMRLVPQEPVYQHEARCDATAPNPRWHGAVVCTLRKGHVGVHVAHKYKCREAVTDHGVLDVWENEESTT